MAQFIRSKIEQYIPLSQDIEVVLQNLPSQAAERYSKGPSQSWRKWAQHFLSLYGQSSDDQKQRTQELLIKLKNEHGYLPQDLFVIEVLWNFGQNSPFYSEISELFHTVMRQYQTTLTPEKFKNLVLKLREGDAFPASERNVYDHYPKGPSKEIQNRYQNIFKDVELEDKILGSNDIPHDADQMIYVLNKMRKRKIGLPERTDFLRDVTTAFKDKDPEEWDEIFKIIAKIAKKHPEWFALQQAQSLR